MHATARRENVTKSVFKYIEDNLVGSNGIPTDFLAADVDWQEGLPFDSDKHTEFLRVRLMDTRGIAHDSVADSGNSPGFLKLWMLYLHAFVKRGRVIEEDDRYLMDKLEDSIKDAFPEEQLIDLNDWNGDDSKIADLEVYRREPVQPKTDHQWLARGFLISLQVTEIDT